MQEQASDFFCFFSLSQLSEPGRLGTALSGPASGRASAMTFSGCDTSPTVDCCSFSIGRTQSPEELGRVGERSLRTGWTARLSCGDTDFFFLMLTRRSYWNSSGTYPRGVRRVRTNPPPPPPFLRQRKKVDGVRVWQLRVPGAIAPACTAVGLRIPRG